MSIGSFSSNGSALPNASADMYTDLNSLQKIKQLGRGDDSDKKQALEAVAKQFESVFLNMMMKSMREANEAFKDDSMSSSNEMDFYQNMFDQQLALTLSKDGVGIAAALMRQLQRQLPAKPEEHDVNVEIGPLDFYGGLQAFMDSKVRSSDAVEQQSMIEINRVKLKDNGKIDKAINSVEEFKTILSPLAEQAANKLGVDPSVILSQAALETGWGQHMIRTPKGENSYNLFGIKAANGWQGEIASVKTLEYENGIAKQQNAAFRSYDSYEESFQDYVDFIKSSSRYKDALDVGTTSDDYIHHLQNSGYATDPNYAKKILGIVKQHFGESESRDHSKRRD